MLLNEFIEKCRRVESPVLFLRSMTGNTEYFDSERSCLSLMQAPSSSKCFSSDHDKFVQETHTLVHQIVECFVEDDAEIPPEFVDVRLIRKCSERDNKPFDDAVERLDVSAENCEQTFLRVAESLFRDNVVNWGRLIALFVFAGKLTQKAIISSSKSRLKVKRKMCHALSSFIITHLEQWITEKGGWVSNFELFKHGLYKRLGRIYEFV